MQLIGIYCLVCVTVDNGQLFEVQPCEVEVNVPEIEQIHDPDDCNLLEQNNEGKWQCLLCCVKGVEWSVKTMN